MKLINKRGELSEYKSGGIIGSDLSAIPFPDTTKLQRELLAKKEGILKDAFTKKGLDVNNLPLLASQVKIVRVEGDSFEHYCLMDGTKLVSFQYMPEMKFSEGNGISVTAELKYIIY